jgi:hypothetical protein
MPHRAIRTPIPNATLVTTTQDARAVVVVAWLLTVISAFSLVLMALSLLNGYGVSANLSIIDLWLGIGLLTRRQWALHWAPVSLSVSVVGGLLGLAFTLVSAGTQETSLVFLGRSFGPIPTLFVVGGVSLLVTLNLWQLRVLSRANVRSLFALADRTHAYVETGVATSQHALARLTQDPRILLAATLAFMIVISRASDRVASARLQSSMVTCLDEFSRARSRADTARIDKRAVPLKGVEISTGAPVLTCRFFRRFG